MWLILSEKVGMLKSGSIVTRYNGNIGFMIDLLVGL